MQKLWKSQRLWEGGNCMANQEHLDILKQRVEIWNQWRQEQQDVIPDLSRTDLRRARLVIADLSHADLSEARLDGAELDGAKLNYAYLKGALGITLEELEKKAKSLQDATMPDGSKHS